MQDYDLNNEIYEANKKLNESYQNDKPETEIKASSHFVIYLCSLIASFVVVVCIVALISKIFSGTAGEISLTTEAATTTQFEMSNLVPWTVSFNTSCTINSFDYQAEGSFDIYSDSYYDVKKYTSQVGRLDVPSSYTSVIETGYSWIYDPSNGVNSFVITTYDISTDEFLEVFCKNNIRSNNYTIGYLNDFPILCWEDEDIIYAFLFTDSETTNHVLVGVRCQKNDQSLISLLKTFEPL